jgi:hypothetical protein
MFVSALSIVSLELNFAYYGLTIIVPKWEMSLGHGKTYKFTYILQPLLKYHLSSYILTMSLGTSRPKVYL